MSLLPKVLMTLLAVHAAKAVVKRSDDVPALQTLVEQQAATIQNLQAQLSTLQNSVSGLGSRMTSVETEIQQDHQKQVAFHVKFSGTYDVPLDVGQQSIVRFDAAVTNLGNSYNTETGLFTAPYNGSYLFILGATHFPTQLHSSHLGIYKTGQHFLAGTYGHWDGDSFTRDVAQTAVYLQMGEQVWVQHTFGGTVFRQAHYTTFVGVLVHAD